ncbi:LuxR C-terminal-related transcriptional regulator [Actinoplanes sp. NBC_00393]|uniref:LuxR C-terminal-related transcriptional regulator n=1 Tax=Actinoplanes sp. NBC_00393 TaxID=2975953 RepID=UPI002E20F249
MRGTLTLVRAGAGWGKTVLVAAWVRDRPEPAAWLSLTERHNDAVVLRDELQAVLSPGASLLVLDDHHRLRDPGAIAVLEAVLRDPAHRLSTVLVGRGEPALPTHCWQASGELTVIGPATLAFSTFEVAELLPVTGDPAAMVARTGGWAAGLRLGDEPESSAVADFLDGEVLAGLPEPARRLLLRTSVLRQVPAALAAELAEERHAARILEGLVRADAFVRPDPETPDQFRYHPQMRTTLLHRLHRDHPGLAPDLHRLAMRWYVTRQLPQYALDHAVAAEDWPALGRIVVESAAPLIVTAERAKLFAVVQQVPPEAFSLTAELAVCGALRLVSEGDHGAVPEQLARVDRLLAGRRKADRLMVETAARLLDATVVRRVRGEMPKLIEQTTRILRRLATVRLEQLPAAHHYRAIAIANQGVGLFWADRADAAERDLWAGLSAARTAGVGLTEINTLGHLGALAFLRGSLHEAQEYAADCRSLAEEYDLTATPQATTAFLIEALIAVERDQVSEAEEALRLALHLDAYPHEAATVMLTCLVRAQVRLARDEPEGAREVLRQARRDRPASLDAPLLDRWLERTRSEVDLALGEPARVVSRYAGAEGRTLNPAEQVCLGQAYLAMENRAEAEIRFIRAADGGDVVSAVAAWIGIALLADAYGQSARSLDAIRRAETLAGPERISRPFRRFGGGRVASLVERRQWLTADPVPGVPAGSDPAPPLPEELSPREIEVLRFLPTVLTAGEIADSLTISVNTVRAHMRAIYRKLGAARRREAVVLAREHGLL